MTRSIVTCLSRWISDPRSVESAVTVVLQNGVVQDVSDGHSTNAPAPTTADWAPPATTQLPRTGERSGARTARDRTSGDRDGDLGSGGGSAETNGDAAGVGADTLCDRDDAPGRRGDPALRARDRLPPPRADGSRGGEILCSAKDPVPLCREAGPVGAAVEASWPCFARKKPPGERTDRAGERLGGAWGCPARCAGCVGNAEEGGVASVDERGAWTSGRRRSGAATRNQRWSTTAYGGSANDVLAPRPARSSLATAGCRPRGNPFRSRSSLARIAARSASFALSNARAPPASELLCGLARKVAAKKMRAVARAESGRRRHAIPVIHASCKATAGTIADSLWTTALSSGTSSNDTELRADGHPGAPAEAAAPSRANGEHGPTADLSPERVGLPSVIAPTSDRGGERLGATGAPGAPSRTTGSFTYAMSSSSPRRRVAVTSPKSRRHRAGCVRKRCRW